MEEEHTTRGGTELDKDTATDKRNTTVSMFAGARSAIDQADAAPVPAPKTVPVPASGAWSGRTQNLQVLFFAGTRPGAAADLKGYRHSITMARPLDAEWSRKLYAGRVQCIRELGEPQ